MRPALCATPGSRNAATRALRQRVSAMASAGVNSLKALDADRLAAVAETYGISLADGASESMAEHFEAKRNAVLSYNK